MNRRRGQTGWSEVSRMGCPAPALLLAAVADTDAALEPAIERHLRICSSCRDEMASLREAVSAVRSITQLDGNPSAECLSMTEIAAFIDSGHGKPLDQLVHLAN